MENNSISWLHEISKLSGCTIRRQAIFWPDPEPDSKKWPDIRPAWTGTGYPVHPYSFEADTLEFCNDIQNDWVTTWWKGTYNIL